MNFTKKSFITVCLILFLQAFLFSAEVKKEDRKKTMTKNEE